MKRKIISLATFFCVLLATVQAQTDYVPAPENMKARTEFQDNKFGVFIHFGLYSMVGDGEWVMQNKDINYREYAKLAGAFDPAGFSAEEWVRTIKNAGAKYLCITTRHHDGFSLFNSKYSDYNSVKATPFHRDIIAEIAAECHRQGISLHLYYSHLDWGRNDYVPMGRTGRGTQRELDGNWEDYKTFMNNQLTELLTNYGKVGAIWFDGLWDRDQQPDGLKPETWGLYPQYAMIHRLQPQCLIGNNHHMEPFPGEDIQIFERDIPGQNTYGYSEQAISRLPLETCQTINTSWGYRLTDTTYKTPSYLIRYLVQTAGKGANLLLNVGPQPDGRFPERSVATLQKIGAWLNVNGETIYGTRAGVVAPCEWGVTTQRGNRLYVHILEARDRVIHLPYTGNKVLSVNRFNTAERIKFKQTDQGIDLYFNETPIHEIDYIVELKFKNNL